MRLQIPKCQRCPKMPDCEHRSAIESDIAKAETKGVTVLYNCKLYPNLFDVGDLVKVQLWEYEPRKGELNGYKKTDRTYSAEVLFPPTGKRGKFSVKFLEEVKICNGERDAGHNGETVPNIITLEYGTVFADQMTLVEKANNTKRPEPSGSYGEPLDHFDGLPF